MDAELESLRLMEQLTAAHLSRIERYSAPVGRFQNLILDNNKLMIFDVVLVPLPGVRFG